MHKPSFIIDNWRARARLHPSILLFYAQMLSLLLYALVDENSSGRALLSAFGVLVLALVVWVINHGRSMRLIAWVMITPAFILSLLSIIFPGPFLIASSSLFQSILYFYAAGSLVVYMLGDSRVTTDELFAAGATFTLLAWAYAFLYLVCQEVFPGSFSGAVEPGRHRTFIELLSLSFTNLTATGLGDILPLSPPARVLVALEQFTGIGYVAVVVSRLIGMTISRRRGNG